MKRSIIILLLLVFAFQSYAQRTGDLYLGLKGGYVPKYKGFVYGARASYSVTDPFEISLAYMMNPKIKMEEGEGANISKSEIDFYTIDLNMHYYLLLQYGWATGPTLGGQYFSKEIAWDNSSTTDKENSFGLNAGWHLRINFTENFVFNGGWRYTAAKDDNSHHTFYLGLGYCFNLY